MAKQDHTTSRSTRNSHRVVSTLICVLAAASVLNSPVQAAPRGAVQVPDGGYLYALDDEDLTDAADGVTIKIWLSLNNVPGDNVVWPLITKEGSYSLSLTGRDFSIPGEVDRPVGELTLYWRRYEFHDGGGNSVGTFRRFSPGGFRGHSRRGCTSRTRYGE